MKAIVRKAYGGVDNLEQKECPIPTPGPGEVLIKIFAFGINRAELYMREGHWGDVAKVSGIECVGIVETDPSGQTEPGTKVAAIMGGMGRTINGSYAEYVCTPASNVIPLETQLPWSHLAAIPESYATAWACLHQNIQLQDCKSILIRGGTSSLGQAAINIAAATGVKVIATSRNPEKLKGLISIGCSESLLDSPSLSNTIREKSPAGLDAVLDIVGNSTLLDSLKIARKGGNVCNAGFLGGSEPINFNPLSDMPPGVNLNFFASFMFGTPDFPLSDIPLQDIVNKASTGEYQCKPGHIFDFKDIQHAHALMESNQASGKIVILTEAA